MALKKDDMAARARGQTQGTGLHMKNIGPLKPLIIRLNEMDRKRLEIYCQSRGLKLSQGARMIIKRCLEEEGL
jgi:hypothetical protein